MDALDAYSRAINLNANICEVWYNVGTLYDACNQINDAKDAYEKAGELGADGVFIRERLENLEAKKASGTAGTLPGPSEPPIQPPLNDGYFYYNIYFLIFIFKSIVVRHSKWEINTEMHLRQLHHHLQPRIIYQHSMHLSTLIKLMYP